MGIVRNGNPCGATIICCVGWENRARWHGRSFSYAAMMPVSLQGPNWPLMAAIWAWAARDWAKHQVLRVHSRQVCVGTPGDMLRGQDTRRSIAGLNHKSSELPSREICH